MSEVLGGRIGQAIEERRRFVLTRKRKAPQLSEIIWGKRVLEITPPGVVSIVLAVLTLLIGIGIFYRAKDMSRVHGMGERYLVAWQRGDYGQIRELYGNLKATDARAADKAFIPSAGLAEYEVPVGTREKTSEANLPVVFDPGDWKDRREPWVLDLSRIQDYQLDQVRLSKHEPLGGASATVTLRSNQGPVKRRVVIVCLTASARCPVMYVQVLPPGKSSVAGF